MRTVIQSAIDILSLGSLYALLALGVALVFGIMRFINFAHGELLMVGGYSLFLARELPFVFMILVCIATVVLTALLFERVAFRPIRGANPATQLVTSFALSFLLQNLAMLTLGPRAKSVGLPTVLTEQFTVGGLRIAKLDILTVVLGVVLMASLGFFLKRSTLGVQMRASAENFEMARLVGVKANTVIASAFAISGLLAASAAIILVAKTGTITPGLGLKPVVIAFVATIMGGLGSLSGAALGGFVLSFLSVTLQTLLPLDLRPFRDAFVFGSVVLIFLLRPQGLIVVRSIKERV
ncbi:MAG: branched-chain amino acid ABC transporter permease [Actinobacteria bacterium]|nr:branched-chain amino acid ABC transporter permease [Actinomycetota bacterium]